MLGSFLVTDPIIISSAFLEGICVIERILEEALESYGPVSIDYDLE